MNLASISENKDREKRIAVTPEIAKKYINLGLNLSLPSNYGFHLGFSDEEYKNLGVNILGSEEELIKNSDIIVQLGLLSNEKQLIFFNFSFSSFTLFEKAFKDPINVWFSFNNDSFSSVNKPD